MFFVQLHHQRTFSRRNFEPNCRSDITTKMAYVRVTGHSSARETCWPDAVGQPLPNPSRNIALSHLADSIIPNSVCCLWWLYISGLGLVQDHDFHAKENYIPQDGMYQCSWLLFHHHPIASKTNNAQGKV